jgi:hypothetical protein
MNAIDEIIARIKQKGDALEARLSRASEKISPEKLIPEAEKAVNDAAMMEKIMSERFSDGESKGQSWAPLSPEGMKDNTSGTPLVKTGALRSAAIAAVKGTFSLEDPVVWRVSSVRHPAAAAQNKRRPFMASPSTEELRPAMDLAKDTMDDLVSDALS